VNCIGQCSHQRPLVTLNMSGIFGSLNLCSATAFLVGRHSVVVRLCEASSSFPLLISTTQLCQGTLDTSFPVLFDFLIFSNVPPILLETGILQPTFPNAVIASKSMWYVNDSRQPRGRLICLLQTSASRTALLTAPFEACACVLGLSLLLPRLGKSGGIR
jgi:hypothetical protein